MAVIELPHWKRVKIDKPRMIQFGGEIGSSTGAPVQHITRLGTRFALDVTVPLMQTEPHGRIWGSRLCQAKIHGVTMRYRQDGFEIGPVGNPKVDGSGQAGMVLSCKAFTPNYAVREGQAFNLVHNGVRYLHFAAAPGVADAAGKLLLSLYPMLRVIPADNATLEFAQVMIEGSLSGNEASWTRLTAPWCDFGTITITEDQ